MQPFLKQIEGIIDPVTNTFENILEKLNIFGRGGKKVEVTVDEKVEVNEEFRNDNDNDLFFMIAILLLMLCIYKNKK